MAAVAILSPHFDDSVLSCWSVLTSPDEVTVVNVFAGAPPAGTSPGWWDHHLGTPEEALRVRAEEDRRALAHAGRASRNLHFVDTQYGPSPLPERELREAIAAALPEGATVYAPASLGTHPDHDSVRGAALELWREGHTVALYADLPHASLRGWPPWVVGGGSQDAADSWDRTLERAGLAPASLAPRVARLDDDALAAKVAAVREYASQLPGFEAMFHKPLDHPEQLGYEVVWALPPSSSSAVAAERKRAAS